MADNQHSDEMMTTSNVAIGTSESPNQRSDNDLNIADVALETLKSKDEDTITNNDSVISSESDHVADGSFESTSQHSDKDLSVADVAFESLKSKDHGEIAANDSAANAELAEKGSSADDSAANSELAEKRSTADDSAANSELAEKRSIADHFVDGNLESTDQHYDKDLSIADVAFERLKSKDHGEIAANDSAANSESAEKGSSSDHVVDGSLKSTDNDLSIADVALESLKSESVVDKHSDEEISDLADKGPSTDHVAVGNLESSGAVNQQSDENLKSKGVVDEASIESTDRSLSTNPVVDGNLDVSRVTNLRFDEGERMADNTSSESRGLPAQHADVALESLKSEDFADKHSDKDAQKTDITVENTKSIGSGSTVEIKIKSLDSQLHNFNVDKNMPVSMFKEKIASEVGLPVKQQRLIFRGKALKDEDLLSDYQIESGHTLHLVDRQPSELQVSSGSPNADTTARSIIAGQDATVTGTHPRADHVSHSVVLGTVGAGDQNEAGNQDISQVIGAVLNSFGIAAQPPMGGIAQPNMQFSIPVQVAQGLQTPGGSAPAIPTLATPIPDSLNTLSEFMNHMERALSQNGYQAENSTEHLPPIELPTNAGGLPSPAALAVVLRHAQRLLSGPTIDSISHTALNLDEEERSTDVTVRTRIQTETMQSGLAMQHLGALLLELGRTMLTLRIGQSHAESSVNAGPAVYISSSGPNPIMVQPFPLQTNSLFGDHATSAANSGSFSPIGIGSIPRHLNIHIHAGPRATNIESNQGELPFGNVGVNSRARGDGDNTTFLGQANVGLPEIRTDARGTGNATSSSMRMKSASETEGGSLSSRSNAPVIPMGLGPQGLQQKRRHRQTRSEAGSSSSASTSYPNQSSTPSEAQMDPASMMNQVMKNPALSGLLSGVSNQPGAGSPDFMRNLMTQLAQNPAMMNTVNQLTQQMDGNQDLSGMMAGLGGSAGSGNFDMSNMVQQMMPFVSQALNRGNSSSNLLQSVPPRKGTLHRRSSSVKSVKSLNTKEKSSNFQMNLENAAQKIVEQYPPIEIFSSIVETAAALHNDVYDSAAFDELCMQEELAQEFIEMLKRDIVRRLHGGTR